MVNNRFLKSLKGFIYFISFETTGLILTFQLLNKEQNLSPVLNFVDKSYPSEILVMWFLLSGFYALYSSFKFENWNFLHFTPMFIYTLATVFAFLHSKVPLITLPFYLTICALLLYDIFEDNYKGK